jgi:c-di-GMP-binding flagellar brake protein YcgR
MADSVAQDTSLEERRSGIDRRSGKDRRSYYDKKRKIQRSILRTGVFVLFKKPRLLKLLQPKKVNFAEILDLSLTGLQAQYSAPAMLKYEHPMLSITSNDGEVKIDDLPFKVVADNKVTNLPNNTQLRRCSLKFEDISDRHKIQLNQIIKSYSV